MKKLLLLIPAILILAGCQASPITTSIVDSSLVPASTEYDFGMISMEDGEVSTKYKLKNTGEEPITITNMYTSCMCTTAQLEYNGETSNKVGMRGYESSDQVNITIQPGETIEVEATYDPNAHGPMGTGVNRRTVIINTNSSTTPEIMLNFTTEVVKTSAELPAKDTFAFQELEYDYGVVKQSQGIITTDFPFTYNGEEDINISALPASCACVTATIDKSNLSKGDQAIITVAFDANLHEEPEGKFFKTIAIMTDPKIEDTPELKIWAEMDLDLGPEAYKLQEAHND